MIPKETEAEIVRLYHGEKWPIGTIATELGVHHTTVQRVLRQNQPLPLFGGQTVLHQRQI